METIRREDNILSVSQLTAAIKRLIETSPALSDCWIRGEISNFTRHSSGHMYFTLKDAGSRIKSVMFASKNKNLNFLPKEGMKVLVRGNVSVYERDGQYQFYVEEMQPDGLGSLFMAFQQMKERLDKEGLFEQSIKKRLPVYPKVIGVVTSPTGAAVRDIITTIRRRYPIAEVLVYPVVVQGTEAAGAIAKAIRHFNQLIDYQVDVMIVGRGGGSLEELWAFNEEVVARAIFESQIPIVSAVGHETDFTIADFVADVRAATPTGAAELVVPHLLELQKNLETTQQRMIAALSNRLRETRKQMQTLAESRVFTRPKDRVLQLRQQIDHTEHQLELLLVKLVGTRDKKLNDLVQRLSAKSPVERVMRLEQRLTFAVQKLHSAAEARISNDTNLLDRMIDKLDAISPLQVMKRGYSLAYKESKGKQLVRSINQMQPGDRLHLRLQDGWLDCQVWGIEEEDTHDGK